MANGHYILAIAPFSNLKYSFKGMVKETHFMIEVRRTYFINGGLVIIDESAL